MAYCTSCGEWIPDGQGSSCSMCYGDVNHGTDGYYRDMMERQEREDQERREQERNEEHEREYRD